MNGRGEVKARRAVAQKFCWRRRAVDRETRAHGGSGKARFGSGASIVRDSKKDASHIAYLQSS